MIKIQLHIEQTPNLRDYKQVDLFDNENISLKSTIQDIKDIGKVFADFSRTFEIPANDNNNKLFKHIYNPDVDGFNPIHKREAKIYLNHMPFRDGFVFLQQIKMKFNKPTSYTLIFYGGLVTLKDRLGNKTLKSLYTADTTLTHTYDAATVKTGFTSTGLSSGTIIYPLITSLKRLYYDSAEVTPNYDGNLFKPSSPSTTRGVSFLDLKPAIKVTDIISKIQSKFNVSFTGFFSTTPVSNLYLWLSRSSGEIIEYTDDNDETKSVQITSFATTDTTDSRVTISDNAFKFTTSGGNRQGSAHVHDVSIASISPTSANFTLKAIDRITGDIISEKQIQGDSSTTHRVGFNNGTNIGGSKFKNFLKRDYEIIYIIETSAGVSFTASVEHTIKHGGSGQANQTKSINYIANGGSSFNTIGTLRVVDHFPDMKILDFLTGLFKLFNLTAFVQEPVASTPVIEVKTLDSFYSSATSNMSGGTIDITEFVDIQSHLVEPTKPFNRVSFEYEETKALLMEQHFSKYSEVFGNEIFDVQDTEIRDADGNAIGTETDKYSPIGVEYKVKVPFSHLKYERIYNEADNVVTEIQWGYAAGGTFKHEALTVPKGNYDSVDLAPLLFYGILQTISDSKPINLMDGSGESITTYWRPSNSNEEGSITTAPSFNLNFDSEFDEWNRRDFKDFDDTSGDFIDKSLFATYYANYVRGAFHEQKRIFKFKCYLPAKFLTQYKLNDQLKIQDRLYRINSIETNLNTGESELELLNLIPNMDAIT